MDWLEDAGRGPRGDKGNGPDSGMPERPKAPCRAAIAGVATMTRIGGAPRAIVASHGGQPMPHRSRTSGAIGVVLSVLVVAGCSASPVSQATSLAATPTAGVDAAAATPEPPPSDASTPAPSAASTPAAPPDAVPPKPGDPTFTLVSETPNANGTTTAQYRVTWTEPDGVASAFLLYGLNVCLRDAKANDGTPCVVRGMKIPRDSLVLLGQVAGDAREMTVSWETGGEGPGPYWSILIRATNAIGDSIFTIVHSENVCYQCTY